MNTGLRMNLPFKRLIAAAFVGACVAACGGSGDPGAGSPTGLIIRPTDAAFKGASGACPVAGGSVEVFIFGGVGPYSLYNTAPTRLTLDKVSVGSHGGSFTVTTNGGCFEDLIIVIEDALRQQTEFTITAEEGS